MIYSILSSDSLNVLSTCYSDSSCSKPTFSILFLYFKLVICEVGDEPFQAGKPITIEGEAVPRQADIVFVVEEKQCAEQDAGYLDNLVVRLAGELQDAGE